VASTPPEFFPVVEADDSLDKIRSAFFVYDCLHIRNLINPKKLKYFLDVCRGIYAAEDARFASSTEHDPAWLREYKYGWIWEDTLRQATDNVFDFQDITACKKLYDIIDVLLGPRSRTYMASQIRRMAPNPEENPWNGRVDFHMDAHWGVDEQYFINVWTPFTPCGKNAPSLEFLLTPAQIIRNYSQYDPEHPLEPRGPRGVNPRMNYNSFSEDELKKNFHAGRFWIPDMNPGDVIIFSSWVAHRTAILPTMTEQRVSLEWRVFLDSFDTSLRPIENLALS
jgi:hypothetical protein